jgi:O-antigen/teichoic acid export membrane protein
MVAKFLTPLELGQIRTMQSFIMLACILAGFGFNTAVLKLCSENRPVEEKDFLFKQNFYYTIMPIAAVLLLIFMLSRTGLLSPDTAINRWLPLYMLVIPAMTYTSLIMVYLQALKKIQLMAKTQVIIRIIGFLILIVLTYLYGLAGFIFSSVFIGYFALPPLIYLIKESFKSTRKVLNSFKKSFYYAKWSLAANATGTLGQYMDIFLLNYLIKDRVSFGYYGLSTIFIVGLNLITSTTQDIAAPHFSERSDDKEDFIRVLIKYQKLMILLSVGVSVLAVIVVPKFISAVYGSTYAQAGFFFQILILKYLFRSCSALLVTSMSIGLGKIKYHFISTSISVVLSFTMTYTLIKLYGLTGAAAAQAVVYFIHLIIVILMLRHMIRIHFKQEAAQAE